ARLSVDSQGRLVLENNSVNGTYVNDARIDIAVLEPGDHIRFGGKASTVFVYESVAGHDGAVTKQAPSVPIANALASSTEQSHQTVHLQDGEESPPPDARLQLVLDQYAVQDIPLTTPLVEIGSVAGPGRIRIQHPSVAAEHAELTFTKEGFALLRDRGTQSGTFVNSERIVERILAEGDLIRLGTCDSRLLLYREARRRPTVLKDIELNRPVITMGRAPDNSVPLNHPTVSQYHAEIHKHGDAFELVDKDSTNGVFVNGTRVKKQVLRASASLWALSSSSSTAARSPTSPTARTSVCTPTSYAAPSRIPRACCSIAFPWLSNRASSWACWARRARARPR